MGQRTTTVAHTHLTVTDTNPSLRAAEELARAQLIPVSATERVAQGVEEHTRASEMHRLGRQLAEAVEYDMYTDDPAYQAAIDRLSLAAQTCERLADGAGGSLARAGVDLPASGIDRALDWMQSTGIMSGPARDEARVIVAAATCAEPLAAALLETAIAADEDVYADAPEYYGRINSLQALANGAYTVVRNAHHLNACARLVEADPACIHALNVLVRHVDPPSRAHYLHLLGRARPLSALHALETLSDTEVSALPAGVLEPILAAPSRAFRERALRQMERLRTVESVQPRTR